MSDFDTDKTQLLSDLQTSRAQLVDVVGKLSADDLTSARRGSWPVSKILDHVLHSGTALRAAGLSVQRRGNVDRAYRESYYIDRSASNLKLHAKRSSMA